ATAAPTVGLSWLVPSSSSSGVPPPLRELEEDLLSLDRVGSGGFGVRSRLLSHLRSLCDRLFPGSWPPDGGCSSWQKAQLGSVTPRPTCHLRWFPIAPAIDFCDDFAAASSRFGLKSSQ